MMYENSRKLGNHEAEDGGDEEIKTEKLLLSIMSSKAMMTRSAASCSSSSSRSQWGSSLRNPRIVRVSRALGGKDRHSKVCTVRGLRDRRIRLSVPTAIQLYDLQDRLGLSQPSKVVDWLLEATKSDIDKLPPLPHCSFPQSDQYSLFSFSDANNHQNVTNNVAKSRYNNNNYLDLDVNSTSSLKGKEAEMISASNFFGSSSSHGGMLYPNSNSQLLFCPPSSSSSSSAATPSFLAPHGIPTMETHPKQCNNNNNSWQWHHPLFQSLHLGNNSALRRLPTLFSTKIVDHSDKSNAP